MNKDNKNELFPWVDNEGNVIGHILRGEAHNGSKKLHPVVHLHVLNSQGELYLQKHPQWKDIQPGKWDTACGGLSLCPDPIGIFFNLGSSQLWLIPLYIYQPLAIR